MKHLKRLTVWILTFTILSGAVFFAGCGNKPAEANDPEIVSGGEYAGSGSASAPVIKIPELGKWHAEVLFSSLGDVIPFVPRLLIAIACGNTAFEVDVYIKNDGTFSYETNTEALKSGASGTISTIIGFFMKEHDLSQYIDNAIEAILPEIVMGKNRDCYGTFEKEESGMLLVKTTDGQTLYFRAFGETLVQLDEEGNPVLTFKRP